MRKHPPVNCHLGSIRVAAKDATLGGFKIPKGTPVVCNSFGMVRDPKIFPNPDVSKFIQPRLDSPFPPFTQQYTHTHVHVSILLVWLVLAARAKGSAAQSRVKSCG